MSRDEEDDSFESVYDDEGREDLMENDEISPREEGFMQGYDDASQDEPKKATEEEDPYEKAFDTGKKGPVQEVKPPKSKIPKKPVKKLPQRPAKKVPKKPSKPPARKAPKKIVKKTSKAPKRSKPAKKMKVKPKNVSRKGMAGFMSWLSE